jgi:hypothetical protein
MQCKCHLNVKRVFTKDHPFYSKNPTLGENLPKFFLFSTLVLRAIAAAVPLRPVDDGSGLSAEAHDLLNCPGEEHVDVGRNHFRPGAHFEVRTCVDLERAGNIHFLALKKSIFRENVLF